MALSTALQFGTGYFLNGFVESQAIDLVMTSNPVTALPAVRDPTPWQATKIILITSLARATLVFTYDALLNGSALSVGSEISWMTLPIIISAIAFPMKKCEDYILGTSDRLPKIAGPDVRLLVFGKDWVRSCSMLVAIFTARTVMRTHNAFFGILAATYIPHLIRLGVLSQLNQRRAENDPTIRTPGRLRGRQFASALIGAVSTLAIDSLMKSSPSSPMNTDLLWVQRGIVGLFLLSSNSYTRAIRGMGVGEEDIKHGFATLAGIFCGIPAAIGVTRLSNAFFGVFAATYIPSLIEEHIRAKRERQHAEHPHVT